MFGKKKLYKKGIKSLTEYLINLRLFLLAKKSIIKKGYYVENLT